jgi:hypothetical protein
MNYYVGMGILFVILGISFLAVIALFLWSIYTFWYTLNSDIIERDRQITESRRRWSNED